MEHFNDQVCKEYGIATKEIEPKAVEELQKINWTGNIRELRNVVERLIILSKDSITKKDVLDYATKMSNTRNNMEDLFDKFGSFAEMRDHLEKEYEKYKSIAF